MNEMNKTIYTIMDNCEKDLTLSSNVYINMVQDRLDYEQELAYMYGISVDELNKYGEFVLNERHCLSDVSKADANCSASNHDLRELFKRLYQ